MYQGQGIGRDLLVDAIIRAAHAGEQVEARFICVDPKDDGARAFYKRFGFTDIEGDEHGRMYPSIAVALAAILGPNYRPHTLTCSVKSSNE